MYTCIQIPQLKLVFDIGVCPSSAVTKGNVFITHTHIDHMAGVLRHCATRELMHLTPPTYYMDTHYTEDFADLIESARRLNHAKMPCTIKGVSPKDHIVLDKRFSIRCFRSIHRIPCIGYVLLETRKKLRPDLANHTKEKLKELRNNGVEITTSVETPLFCYPGDTSIDVMHREELARRAQVLFIELTFVDDRVTPESSRKHGHIHIQDIINNEELFADNSYIVFMHFSSRYKSKDLRSMLLSRLPESILDKAYILPNDNIFSPSSESVDLTDLAVLQP